MTRKASAVLKSDAAPDPRTVRKVIDDLCLMWERAIEEPKITFRPEIDERRAVAIHAHAHHAVRLARALRILDEAGCASEIIALVRQIFEVGVTAAWLLVTPGSGDVLLKDGASQRKKAQEHMTRLGHSDGSTAGYVQSRQVLESMEAVANSFQFEQRCLALQAGSDLYLTYRSLSMSTHSGLGITDHYFIESGESEIGVAFDPNPDFETREAHVGIAACLLLLAVNADELARAKPHRTTQIATAAKRLGVSSTITCSDGRVFANRPDVGFRS